MRIHPYKLELNNKLEIEAIITGSATLFCGVLFVSDDNDLALLIIFILLIIIALNVKFSSFWWICMTFTLASKHKTWNVLFKMIAVGRIFIGTIPNHKNFIVTFRRSVAEEMLNEVGEIFEEDGQENNEKHESRLLVYDFVFI